MTKKLRILLTGFSPYRNERNASFEIAQYICKNSTMGRLDFSLCSPVPNSFQHAAPFVAASMKKIKPDFVISLGESSIFAIHAETHAANKFGGSGEMVDGMKYESHQPICAAEPDWLELSLPQINVESREGSPPTVVVGNTPNNFFICNKLAYDLQTQLKKENSVIRYGFIHVPSYESAAVHRMSDEQLRETVSRKIQDYLSSACS